MSGGKRFPHSALSTPTPFATSASVSALAHSHSPTATPPTTSLHNQRHQPSTHSIAISNMGDRPNIVMSLTPPADHPGSGGGVGVAHSNKVGAPSFAAVVSASPSTARSPSTSIYSAQEHAQSSSAHISNKNHTNNSNSDLGGGDVAALVSTNPPHTTIVTSDAHRRSPSGGSLTSSSRYHSPLASPGGSADNSAHSIHVSDAEPTTTISILGPSNSTMTSTPSMVQEGGGIAAPGNDADPETDSAGHDSGESSDDVEIYLDTLGLHDSAARMHVLNASRAMGDHTSGPASRSSSNNPKPLFDPANQHSQGQGSVSVSAASDSSKFGARALQLQDQQQASIRSLATPNSTIPPSHANLNISIATANALNPNSNSNFGALRVTGPNLVSPSLQQQPRAATGVDESGDASIGGPAAKNVLSPLPLSIPLSTSPSNSSSLAALDQNNPRSGLQPQQFALPAHKDQQQQQRQFTTPNQGRNPPRAPIYSTIPLPEVDGPAQGPGSSQYDDHASADLEHQKLQLDLDRQHQLQLQLQQQQQDQQQMYGHSGPGGSVHGPAHGPTQLDISGLTGVSISGDGRTQQHHLQHQQLQQQFSLGITSSQTLPSISTSGPFDFDFSPNTYSGPTTSSNPTTSSGSGFPTSASDSTFLGGPGAGSASAGILDLGPKTPNVYINGLPPHFPEDQLFALASPFGEIRSVRTFTRHVRDSESGYGFVLFETIEAAEKCILSLRRYRNLHPTFSKQIHKIPGTIYAQGASGASNSSWDEYGSGDSGGSSPGDSGSSGPLSADASFKARMESLQDPTSTNLYMEGLPLSIDEPTLAALVSPHRISSSRFFQTRLSNPPRIIAFVRLETRAGAEEVIERLHGRMVRGWNDTGSRISVRFADTSEQRELRRQERAAQEGDGSPARLTIAQAALLNLRGQQLRPSNSASPIDGQGQTARVPSSSGRGGGFNTSVSMPDFSSNAHLNLPPVIGGPGGGHQGIGIGGGGGASGLEVDYSLAPGRSVIGSRSRSPYQIQSQGQYSLGHTPPPPLPTALPISSSSADPAMSALLESLRSTGVPFSPNSVAGGGGYGDSGDYDYNGMSSQRGVSLGHGNQYHQDPHLHQHQHHLPTTQSLDSFRHQYGHSHSHPHSRPAPVYTRSGYTATEEYIMRAHAENAAIAHTQAQQQHQQQLAPMAATSADRRRPAPLDLRRRRSADDPEGQNYQDHMAGDGGAANIAVGVRGYRAQASIGRLGALGSGQGSMSSPPTGSASLGMLASSNSMPSMSSLSGVVSAGASPLMGVAEEDYHASSGNDLAQRHNTNIYQAHVNARLAREHHVQRPPMPLSPSIGGPPSSKESSLSNATVDTINYQHAAAHMRSTTLPQRRPRDRGHYQQNSMSMPTQNLRTPQHAAVSAMSGPRGIDGAPGSNGTIHENEAAQEQQQQFGSRDGGNGSAGSSNNAGPIRSPMFGDLSDSSSATHSPSPSLISPTLTYSSQTPSTLSPATPFFGSFHSQAEGFGEKNGPSNVDQHQHHQQPKKNGPTGGAMTPSSLRSLTSESV